MHIQTRLEPEVLEAARKAAALEGTSLSEYLRRLVEADLGARKGNGGAGDEGESGQEKSDHIR